MFLYLSQDNRKLACSCFFFHFIFFVTFKLPRQPLISWFFSLARYVTSNITLAVTALPQLGNATQLYATLSCRGQLNCPLEKSILFVCNYFFLGKLVLLIFILLYFHAGSWMAIYSVCAASQDWLIQDLVRGRIENLICFKIIRQESKLRIHLPF